MGGHLASFLTRVVLLVSTAVTFGVIAWVPASRVLVQSETRKAVFLQRERYLEDGGPVVRADLERAGIPGMAGVALDSISSEVSGWYVRFSHQLSPAHCEYKGSGVEGQIRCRS